MSKEFVFDVDVPLEVLSAEFFGSNLFFDENVATPIDDIIQTSSDNYNFIVYIIIFIGLLFGFSFISRKNKKISDSNNNAVDNSQL